MYIYQYSLLHTTSAEDISNIEKTTINHINGIDQRLELLNQIQNLKSSFYWNNTI